MKSLSKQALVLAALALALDGHFHSANLNGLRLYCEIYLAVESANASGDVLLHGGIDSVKMFGLMLPTLSRTHMVITVDLQAHRRTADIDRPLRFELMVGM